MIGLLVLSISITAKLCAQDEFSTAKTSKTFEMQPDAVRNRFFVALDKGNKLQIELSNMDDLEKLSNIDSLLKIYLRDIKPFKDSLSDELSSKRIDYLVDATTGNKIRIQIFKQSASSFLVKDGDVAALKLQQDTINILVPVSYHGRLIHKKPLGPLTRYYRISFFVNQATDLGNYADGGLHEKIATLLKSRYVNWIKSGGDRWGIKGGDNSIFSNQPGGYISTPGDFLELKAAVNVQNYKNYFVPSFNLGAAAYIRSNIFKYEIGVAWEPHFLFAKNSAGNLQTFRNDFITLTLGMEPVTSKVKSNEPHFDMFQHLTIGYLVRQKGNIIDNHTFRIGTGSVNFLGDKIKLEPVFYFHDLFKNVTPGIRLSLNF
jgi:hypothetical protein